MLITKEMGRRVEKRRMKRMELGAKILMAVSNNQKRLEVDNSKNRKDEEKDGVRWEIRLLKMEEKKNLEEPRTDWKWTTAGLKKIE